MIEILVSTLSVAVGIVLGTLLTWVISYLVMRKYIGRFIRLVTTEPELNRILKDIIDHITESVSTRKYVVSYHASGANAKDIKEKISL